jgi:hypothetical protein
MLGKSLEFCEPYFCHSPESLDAIDVCPSSILMDKDELIFGMIDPIMAVSQIDKSIIAKPEKSGYRFSRPVSRKNKVI